MYLSATLNTARGKAMAVWSIITLTPVVASPLETFASTQRYAEELRLWLQLMKPRMSMLLVRL